MSKMRKKSPEEILDDLDYVRQARKFRANHFLRKNVNKDEENYYYEKDDIEAEMENRQFPRSIFLAKV